MRVWIGDRVTVHTASSPFVGRAAIDGQQGRVVRIDAPGVWPIAVELDSGETWTFDPEDLAIDG